MNLAVGSSSAKHVHITCTSIHTLAYPTTLTHGPSDKPVHTLSFIQTPPAPTNPNRKTPDYVALHMMLLRLKEKETDILVTVNVPHYPGEYAKPAQGEPTSLMKDADALKEKILASFEIRDWSLFHG